MYVVGIGGSIDEDEVMQMSSTPQTEGKTFWLLNSFDELDQYKSVNDILSRICGTDPTKAQYYGKFLSQHPNPLWQLLNLTYILPQKKRRFLKVAFLLGKSVYQ